MTQAISATKLLLTLGPTFAALCGLTTKGINFSAETSDWTVDDCEDLDAPVWTQRVVDALSATVSGSGVLAMEDLATYRDWFASGEAREVRVKLDIPGASDGGYWSGTFVLSSFNVTGERRTRVACEMELQNNGPVVWVANP